MKPTNLVSALFTLLLGSLVSAKKKTYGINCKSSPGCEVISKRDLDWTHNLNPFNHERTNYWQATHQYTSILNKKMRDLPDDLYIEPNNLIACVGTLCTWIEAPDHKCYKGNKDLAPGMTMKEVKKKGDQVQHHGCDRCGQVARSWPQGKGIEDVWCSGYLQFGYVPDEMRNQYCGNYFGVCDRWSTELYGERHEGCVSKVEGGCEGSQFEELDEDEEEDWEEEGKREE